MRDFLNFSHDRKIHIDESCKDLFNHIESFVNASQLDEWYGYFDKSYSLPKEVVKNQLRRYLEVNYDYQKSRFRESLSLKRSLISFFKSVGVLFFALFHLKRKASAEQCQYRLMLDGVETTKEASYFLKLIDLFGKENVLIVALNKFVLDGYKVVFRPYHWFYRRSIVFKVFVRESLKGFWTYWRLSFKLNINVFDLSREVTNNYMYYSSMFEEYKIIDIIQYRHYQTNPVKNYLLHKYGGRYSTYFQRNIFQAGRNGFYYNADVLFSLGKETAQRAFKYGANIKKVVPIGSLGMENFWFRNPGSVEKYKYDVLFLGVNIGLHYQEAYDSFQDDYYDCFRWLIKLQKKYPELKIAIKHHPHNKSDSKEESILMNSGIEKIESNLNSYKMSFSSRCVVSFASTMVHEMYAHGVPSFFMDPGGRSAFCLPLEKDFFRNNRSITFEEFQSKVISTVHTKDPICSDKEVSDNLCLKSDHASERIFSFFNNAEVDKKRKVCSIEYNYETK